MINEHNNHHGIFKITCKSKGKVISEEIVKNRITNVALNKMINILDGIDPDLQIKYLAIGTDNSPIDDNDSQLGTEVFRTQFQTSDNNADGEFTTTFTILDSEAVTTWQEIGIFCGSGATASANSGTMLSRILYNRNKTSLEEIEITRLDKIRRN
jgi:hypothetical protein